MQVQDRAVQDSGAAEPEWGAGQGWGQGQARAEGGIGGRACSCINNGRRNKLECRFGAVAQEKNQIFSQEFSRVE